MAGFLLLLCVMVTTGRGVLAIADYSPPANSDPARRKHGLWGTSQACKSFGKADESIYWNNIAGTNWKAYYLKVKAYCEGAGADNTNPDWRHPFPCTPFNSEFFGGAHDNMKYGCQTDGQYKHEELMAALATAAENNDDEKGPALMCEWFAGDRDWGGVESVENPAHARDERPCGCYFSAFEDKGAFYYNACAQPESGVRCGTNMRACACMNLAAKCPTCGGGAQTASCSNGVKDGAEQGVDCGGGCTFPCHCFDGKKSGNEGGVECGGSCQTSGSKGSGYGERPGTTASCYDGCQNGDESGVDEGGSCGNPIHCYAAPSLAPSTGFNYIKDGNEIGINCGGSCDSCHCFDGFQTKDELGIDCGGDSCRPCHCLDRKKSGDEEGIDAGGVSCGKQGVRGPTCSDEVMNGDETGIDCGGSCGDSGLFGASCADGCKNARRQLQRVCIIDAGVQILISSPHLALPGR